MGRTLPTFNTWLQEEIASWQSFRRGLRAEQRPAFDRLFTRARRHTAEATCAARAVPFDALVIAILLDQELEIERLAAEVAALRAPADAAAPAADAPRTAAPGRPAP